jgi:high-affinity iron transporter
MFANLMLGLREGLEASLIVGILIAYVVKVGRRDAILKIWLGVLAAVVVSIGLGVLLSVATEAFGEAVEPLIAGFASIAAAAMVTWMIFWMANTAKNMRSSLEKDVSKSLATGTAALVAIAFLAVVREGAELSLFVWAAAQNADTFARPLIGALLGILAAAFLGYLIYRGALKFNLSTFFAWSGAYLVIIAGSILIGGVGDLQEEAGWFPFLNSMAYDVEAWFPEGSVQEILLRGLIGFHTSATWLMVVVWVAYVGITLPLFLKKAVHRRITPVETTEIEIIKSVN